jgi:hypothetical protein
VKVGNFGNGFTDVWTPIVRGNLLFTTSQMGGTGVYIVDVSNPAMPVQVAHLPIGKTYHVAFAGNVMYVSSNQTSQVQLFNIANPAAPVALPSITVPAPPFQSPGKVHTVWVRGNRLMASHWNATSVWDVSTPEAPALLGKYSWGWYQHSADMDETGRYLYVAFENLDCPGGSQSYVHVVDMVNPASPALVKSLALGPATPHYTFVRGNTLWVSWHSLGVRKFDITNPADPVLTGAFDTTLGAGGACHSNGNWGVFPLPDGKAAVSDWNNGLMLVQ